MNSNAVYMIGNGRMAAAFCNGEMLQCFGPPYSSPSVFESRLIHPAAYSRSPVRRMPQCGIWQMDLRLENAEIAKIIDFALPEEPCLVRRVESTEPICVQLRPHGKDAAKFHYEETARLPGETRILFKTKNGNAVYNDYPLPFPQFFSVVIRGAADVQAAGAFSYDIFINGAADLLIIGGPSYPECDENTARLAKLSYQEMLASTRLWWSQLFSTISVTEQLPAALPRRAELIDAIESTVVNLTVQQAKEGGVLAGYAYHLGYVRDQYGVCMAMLRLGMYAQARRMLEFYIGVFRENQCILNAQGMGVKGLFHFAENDATEIPGYLLLQFFRYAEFTGDTEILTENLNLLIWLYERQLSQLQGNMMPFNGDETYIAGGLLPRDVINEGSAEATMLFILSGKALLRFLQRQANRESHGQAALNINEMEKTLESVEKDYPANVAAGGQYALNNPARLLHAEQPPYRYGVCMNLGKGACDFFGWTKRCENGAYVCPRCFNRGVIPQKTDRIYHLPSALLMPAYLRFEGLDQKIIVNYLQRLTEELKERGHVYSNQEAQKNVGYDYGLLLCNLVRYRLPGTQAVYDKLLDLLDEAGAWSEYYVTDQPAGTRYRPWESGINIDALIEYATEGFSS